ncbi:PQQ-binding-like beta-propeller repeat protein [Halorussus lipolyticus]|uniref:outer membrane protein assembly factor BamB family protein n=1 Tax=Halorussus lipolyticus TaxID=3034024 RepID=UPI0023E8BE2B|nr:PQQ-binding-like beta-propeller repeat protein [Halorussus sp. DT80]
MPSSTLSRRSLLAGAGGLTTGLAGCAAFEDSSVTEESASFPTGEWPQVARDATNTGFYPDATVPSKVTRAWDVSLGGWPYTSPIVGSDRVFIAMEKTLAGIAAAGGETEFEADLPHEPGGTPAYDSAESTVYVPTYDRTTEEDGAFVHAFDAEDGRETWTRKVGDESVYGLTLRDGTIYARTSEAVVALADGEEVWRHEGLGPLAYSEYNIHDSLDLTGNVAPAVTGETVYVPVRHGVLALDSETGERRWRADVRYALGLSVGEAGVYAQGYEQFRAFARDGSGRWTRDDVGGISSPTLGRDAVYAKDGSRLRELDPKTGETRWSFDLRTGVDSAPSPVLENAVIAPSHRAVAIRRGNGLGAEVSGRKLWATDFDPATFAAPAVGAGLLLLVDPFRYRLVALEAA